MTLRAPCGILHLIGYPQPTEFFYFFFINYLTTCDTLIMNLSHLLYARPYVRMGISSS